MIVDTLANISLYRNISEDLFKGLEFIMKATGSIAPGEYPLSGKVIAMVTEYQTKEFFERGYEAHKHVIDIQYPIIGKERVKWSPIDHMRIHIPYDPVRDRTFYINPTQITSVDIGDGIFAIMFPNDGHSPQHFIIHPEMIKKITVKVTV